MIYGDKFKNIDDSYLVEFVGKESRNDAYIVCLNKLEELIQLYVRRIIAIQEILDNMVDLYMKIDRNNFLQIDIQIRQYGRNGNITLDPLNKEIHERSNRTWKEFTALSKKFSIKYSTVTMDEKEKFCDKIEPYFDNIDRIYGRYTDRSFKTMLIEKEQREVIDAAIFNGKGSDYGAALLDTIGAWYEFLVDEIDFTMADIKFIYKKMGSKDNPMFKLINKDYVSRMKSIDLKHR